MRGIVEDANGAGYDINHPGVGAAIRGLAPEKAGLEAHGTQMGRQRGGWRGGGYSD